MNLIFQFENIKDNQFYFLTIPSFKPEKLLIFDQYDEDYNITLVSLTKNYWTLLNGNYNTNDIEKIISQSKIERTIGDRLFLLLENVINEAREPKASVITLDGVVYKLSRQINGNIKTVFKHSPDNTSKSGKVIEIVSRLIDNIDDINTEVILDVENIIESI